MKPTRSRFLCLAPLALVMGTGSAHATILASPIVSNSATPFSVPGFQGSNAVDNSNTEYASQGQGVNTFLEFDFGSPQTFNRIVVINRDSAGFSDWIADFTLTFDGGATTSVTRTAMRGVSQFHDIGLRTATTVRLDVDTVGIGDAFNNTGVMEVIFARTPAGQSIVSGVTILNAATAFSANFAATNAIDGNIGRIGALTGPSDDFPEYASQGLGVNAFVDFDLGAVIGVGGFDWFDRPAAADRVTAFDMIFSQDNVFGNGDDIIRSYANSAMAMGDVFAPINARYVRYDVTAASGANTGMSEMFFYQIPEPSSAMFIGLVMAGGLLRRRRAV